jgi:hypothetical protein
VLYCVEDTPFEVDMRCALVLVSYGFGRDMGRERLWNGAGVLSRCEKSSSSSCLFPFPSSWALVMVTKSTVIGLIMNRSHVVAD